MVTTLDKRTTPRMAMHRLVRFEHTALEFDHPQNRSTQGLGRDISPQGMSLLTDCPLHPGEILRLHVSLKPDWPSIPVFSQVRWISRVRQGLRVGLQFLA